MNSTAIHICTGVSTGVSVIMQTKNKYINMRRKSQIALVPTEVPFEKAHL